MYKRILVAMDGSEFSQCALKEAIRLAVSLNSFLLLVHVLNKTPRTSTAVDQSTMQRLVDDLRGTGESILHEAKRAVREAGVATDSRLIEALGAEPGECIVREAKFWPADLIVCGSHRDHGLHLFPTAGDAEYIIQHSSVPVLLVHPPLPRPTASSHARVAANAALR